MTRKPNLGHLFVVGVALFAILVAIFGFWPVMVAYIVMGALTGFILRL